MKVTIGFLLILVLMNICSATSKNKNSKINSGTSKKKNKKVDSPKSSFCEYQCTNGGQNQFIFKFKYHSNIRVILYF